MIDAFSLLLGLSLGFITASALLHLSRGAIYLVNHTPGVKAFGRANDREAADYMIKELGLTEVSAVCYLVYTMMPRK